MTKRTETGYSNRAELVTPRSGVSIPDGTGHYLIRGDVIEADSEIALANRGSFMRAPGAEKPTPTSTRTSNPATTFPKGVIEEDEESSIED